MAKKSYIGVDGKARQIKKWYVGVGNKARKVKKGYIGVGGVARPFFGSGYYGTAEPLSSARTPLGVSVGNYALFVSDTNSSDVIDVYSSTLTHITTTLPSATRGCTGTTVGNYALVHDNDNSNNIVYAISSSLVVSTAANLSSSHYAVGCASVGDYAIFAGGRISSSTLSNGVDAYNSSLIHTTTTLNAKRLPAGSASLSSYAIFAGGLASANSVVATVEAFNSSLVLSTVTSLSTAKRDCYGARAGDYAIFAGGYVSSIEADMSATSETYNNSLVHSTATNLSAARFRIATSSGDNAYYFGGQLNSTSASNAVDIYSSSLVKSMGDPLPSARYYSSDGATIVGSYILVTGGYDLANSKSLDAVEVYLI